MYLLLRVMLSQYTNSSGAYSIEFSHAASVETELLIFLQQLFQSEIKPLLHSTAVDLPMPCKCTLDHNHPALLCLDLSPPP